MARKSKFDILRKKAFYQASKWGQSSTEKPVLLHQLGKSLGVTGIRFEPLLSMAGLEKSSDGFNIIINTEAFGVDFPSGTILKTDYDDWSKLNPPVRFSVAHELAHIIFYDLAKDENNALLRKNVDELEVACNQIASTLLIPSKFIIDFTSEKLFDASRLNTLRKELKVSPDVLVWRFTNPDMKELHNDQQGYIALIRQEYEKLNIIASVTFGAQAQARFDKLSIKSNPDQKLLFDHLQLPDEIYDKFYKENEFKQKINVRGSDSFLPCDFSMIKYASRPPSYLVTIEVTGFPEALL